MLLQAPDQRMWLQAEVKKPIVFVREGAAKATEARMRAKGVHLH